MGLRSEWDMDPALFMRNYCERRGGLGRLFKLDCPSAKF